jgi:hypothetical protein
MLLVLLASLLLTRYLCGFVIWNKGRKGFFKYAGSIKENGENLPGKHFASNKQVLNSLQIKNPKPRSDFGFSQNVGKAIGLAI